MTGTSEASELVTRKTDLIRDMQVAASEGNYRRFNRCRKELVRINNELKEIEEWARKMGEGR